eukprot:comp19271_c0_seq1/m.22089 comp19271_c0_seq1/g.22089  ORF comp19271_c0_seq1/g.22089 comp19271_c0_seq1/m.22089 type:complete len:171 (-) comp19271_c0_seq1:541-1053(-)
MEDPELGPSLATPLSQVLSLLREHALQLAVLAVLTLWWWRNRSLADRSPAGTASTPAASADRNEALLRARERQQRLHEEQAALAALKRKEEEERKRLQKLEEFDRLMGGEGGKGATLGNGTTQSQGNSPSSTQKPDKKKPLRVQESNPLMGFGGGSSGFRSSRPRPRAGG